MKKLAMKTCMTAIMVSVGLTASCNPANFFAPLQGPRPDSSTFVVITFINETPYRVITWWGAYNPLAPDGLQDNPLAPETLAVDLVLETGEESAPGSAECMRRIDIAGPDLRKAVELSELEDVDPDDINDRIGFSDLPEDDPDPNQPTAGTADPVRFELGVDYNCGDELEITFREVEGEFVVELTVVEEDEEE